MDLPQTIKTDVTAVTWTLPRAWCCIWRPQFSCERLFRLKNTILEHMSSTWRRTTF